MVCDSGQRTENAVQWAGEAEHWAGEARKRTEEDGHIE
jgi:hypothetical protein